MAHEYIRKPLTVTAIQWTGENLNEVREFVAPLEAARRGDAIRLYSPGIGHAQHAYPSDWIIKSNDIIHISTDAAFRGHFERVGGGGDD